MPQTTNCELKHLHDDLRDSGLFVHNRSPDELSLTITRWMLNLEILVMGTDAPSTLRTNSLLRKTLAHSFLPSLDEILRVDGPGDLFATVLNLSVCACVRDP